MVTARATALVCEQRANKRAQYLGRESGVPGTAIPERIRQRQHPLAYWNFRNDAVDEAGGGIGHSPSTTRRAEPSALTRECDQAIVAAAIAVDADETFVVHSLAAVLPRTPPNLTSSLTRSLVEQGSRRFHGTIRGDGAGNSDHDVLSRHAVD